MNVYETVEPVYSKDFLDVILNAYKTNPAAALAPTLKACLFKDENFVPDPTKTKTDLDAIKADFTDYAEQALTLTVPVSVSSDTRGAIGSVTFSMPTVPTVTGNTIWGYYIYSGTTLVTSEKFAGGLSAAMGAPGAWLTLNLILPQGAYQMGQ